MPNDIEVSISLEVSEAIRLNIVQAFGPFENDEEERTIIKINQIAFKAFTDWFSGNKRYRTLTELYIDWVEQVYLNLFPDNEAPSAERIYDSLNMPFGQASYISRVLASKTQIRWRQIANAELRETLRDVESNARQYINDGDQAQVISLQMSQISYYELSRICSKRRHLDRSYLMPQAGQRSGDFRFISIPACTIIDLIDNPNW
jgi:hypothetical protein